MFASRILKLLFFSALLAACQSETHTDGAETSANKSALQQPATQPNEPQASEFLAPILRSTVVVAAQPVLPPLKPERLVAQSFPVSGVQAAAITTTAGFQFAVPANAFVDANGQPFTGQAAVTVREAFTVADFIRAGLMTMAGNSPLRSGGMFQFTATDARTGAPLTLAPGKQIQGKTPLLDSEYQLFRGQPAPNGGLDWVEPVALAVDTNGISTTTTTDVNEGGTAIVPAGQAMGVYFPLPDTFATQYATISQFVDSCINYRAYAMLLASPALLETFLANWDNFSASVARTRATPCTQPMRVTAWQQQHLPIDHRLPFVWLNNQLLVETDFINTFCPGVPINRLISQGYIRKLRHLPSGFRDNFYDMSPLINYVGNLAGFLKRHANRAVIRLASLQDIKLCLKAQLPRMQIRTISRDSLEYYIHRLRNDQPRPQLFRANGTVYAPLSHTQVLGIGFNPNGTPAWGYWLHWNLPVSNRSGVNDNWPVAGISNTVLIQYLSRLDPETPMFGNYEYEDIRQWRRFTTVGAYLQRSSRQNPQRANLNASLSRQYNFALNEIGWYNCDIYMRERWQSQDVIVQLDAAHTPANTQLYVVYPQQRMVFQFPINTDGKAQVRLFERFTGQLLLVSGDEATAVTANAQTEPLAIAWHNPLLLNQAISSQ